MTLRKGLGQVYDPAELRSVDQEITPKSVEGTSAPELVVLPFLSFFQVELPEGISAPRYIPLLGIDLSPEYLKVAQ